mmetsp:Transcript_2829/g.4442  ORF Transcript_2829/g.4442 Transcript_2829/m.4442 type:complete len:206 (-) Transcript_2829:218-835(-)
MRWTPAATSTLRILPYFLSTNRAASAAAFAYLSTSSHHRPFSVIAKKVAPYQYSHSFKLRYIHNKSFSNTVRFMSDGNDEVAKSKAAKHDGGQPTVFDKVLSGEWSSDKVYEDDLCLAFRDINPQAPVHVLVIPKNRDGLTQLSNAREDQKDILGHLMYVAQSVGKKECPKGFRIVVNDGEQGAQSVYHLHLHVLGGKQMGWPPG